MVQYTSCKIFTPMQVIIYMEKVSTVIRNRYAYYLGMHMRQYVTTKRKITEKDFQG